MKPIALIYALWEKNLPAVLKYLKGKRRVILIPDFLATRSAMGALESVGAQIRILPMGQPVALDQLTTQLLSTLRDSTAIPSLGMSEMPPSALDVLQGQISQNLPVVRKWIDVLEQAALEYEIEITLLNEDETRDSKVLAQWSHARGIPMLHVEHGVPIVRNYNGAANYSDDIAVFGQRSAEYYLDMGVPSDRLHLVGNPAWDLYSGLLEQKAELRSRLGAQYGLDVSGKWIVFGTTWNAYLSALDQRNFDEQANLACLSLKVCLDAGLRNISVIVKDRLDDRAIDVKRSRLLEIAREYGIERKIRYALDDARPWIVASDIVVSFDSNLSVEAIVAGTLPVNVLWDLGEVVGGGFSASDGVATVGTVAMGDTLVRLLTDAELSARLYENLYASRDYFHFGNDGKSTQRLAELIASKARRIAEAAERKHIWQQYLDVEEIDATGYHAGARADLVEMFSNNPKIVLDIGCAAGGTGELLKRKYPSCKVWGVETNRSAAKVASERLDRVLVGKFEDFDLEREGIAKGTLDGVILADVLEHMYNPWAVMVALQPYLSVTAQVIISIPNVRNLKLMEDLAAGFWRYDVAGLLDITHIRFFTLKEFRRFLHETGFHVNSLRYGIDQRLAAFFQANKDTEKLNVELGRMTLANVGKDELMELCSLQFYINAGVGALNDDIRPYHSNNPYAEYLQRCRLTEAEAKQYDKLLARWQQMPKVAVAVYLPAEADARLTATVKNLSSQLYQDITIWVLSPLPLPQGVPVSERFRWLNVQGALAGGLSQIAAQSDADWLGWLNAGDQLEPQALLRVVEAAQRHTEWQFIYSDEDLMLAEGEFGQPVFKPDFDPNYLLSMPYLGGLSLIRRNSLVELGGVNQETNGAEQIDLALRCWQRWGENAIGHIPSIFYHRCPETCVPVAQQVAAAQLACTQALQRAAIPAVLETGWAPGSFRWSWQGGSLGMVSLLIAVRDDLPRLQRCIEGLFQHTRYPEFEILLLDNGSSDAATLAFLQGLDAMADPRLRVFRYPTHSSLAQLHNLLAREARGQVLGFMHFDCVPLDANWLEILTGELQRPDVAVVSPRLLDGQGRVLGGGLILGIDGGYAPAFAGLMHNDAGPMGRAHVAQSFSALSGGMLLMRRASFEQLGGFDLGCGAAADVDFCLRLRQYGLRALWTPHVSLMSEGTSAALDWAGNSEPGSAAKLTIDDSVAVVEPLLNRWLTSFSSDPAYNQNLVSVGQPFAQEHRQVLQRPTLDWKPLPRVLLQPADIAGCGYYRMLEPASVMARKEIAEALSGFDLLHPNEQSRLQPDAVIFQRQIYENQVKRMRQTRKFLKSFMVFELDDLITNVPVKSLHRNEIPADTVRWLREATRLCDRFIVSTESLAQAMRGYNDDIRVVPNRLDSQRWGGLRAMRNQGQKPRVGWAGSVSHSGDLELIVDVVKELADEVDWVFLGMCPEFLRPYVRDFHPGVPFEQYPAKLANLGLDLALAPLELNAFNESKSNLKLLEYGVLGYPVICTDITPYQCNLPVLRVKNRFRDWVAAIRDSLADRDALGRKGAELRQVVLDQWMLDDHCAEWLAAWLP